MIIKPRCALLNILPTNRGCKARSGVIGASCFYPQGGVVQLLSDSPQLSLARAVSDLQLGVGLLETPQLHGALLQLHTHKTHKSDFNTRSASVQQTNKIEMMYKWKYIK